TRRQTREHVPVIPGRVRNLGCRQISINLAILRFGDSDRNQAAASAFRDPPFPPGPTGDAKVERAARRVVPGFDHVRDWPLDPERPCDVVGGTDWKDGQRRPASGENTMRRRDGAVTPSPGDAL